MTCFVHLLIFAGAVLGQNATLPQGGAVPSPAAECGPAHTDTQAGSGCTPIPAEPHPADLPSGFGFCKYCLPPGDIREFTKSELASAQKRIAEIDTAFVQNDLSGLIKFLGPPGGSMRTQLESQMRELVDAQQFLSRSTRILKAWRGAGSDAVYTVVESVVRPRTGKSNKTGPQNLVKFDRRQRTAQIYFFTYEPDTSGRVGVSPILARVERFDAAATAVLDGLNTQISCDVCKWSFTRPEGWFPVPRAAGEGVSMDSFSLIHPNLKISIDFDSYANPTVVCPLNIAERDHEVLTNICGLAPEKVKVVHRNAVMEGPVVRADLVIDYSDQPRGGPATRVHRCYRLLAPYLYNFIVRGDADEVSRHQHEIRPILDSLKVDAESASDTARIAWTSKTHLKSARVSPGRFVDDCLGISIDPPSGWNPTVQPARGRFFVKYTPPSAGDGTSISIFAWEGESRCFGEQDVVRFVENRRTQLPGKEYINWVSKRFEITDHPNTVDVTFEVESTWTSGALQSTGVDMQELFVAIPAGRYLVGFIARAPRSTFEQHRDIFTDVIESYRHTTR